MIILQKGVKMINLEKELDGFYGTQMYHWINSQYACTDGIRKLLTYFTPRQQDKLINIFTKLCNYRNLMMFGKIIIKNNKVSVITYKDITENGKSYIDPMYYNDLFTVKDLKDCEIVTMVYNYIWLLLSEY